jgi:glutathione S-transferase
MNFAMRSRGRLPVLTLYDDELCGKCYQVRLLLGFLGIAAERIPIEIYPAREHRSPRFLAISPRGELPAIDDDGLILSEVQAILVYLASKYDALGRWYPRDHADLLGSIQQWLSVAAELDRTLSVARLGEEHSDDGCLESAHSAGHTLLRVLDQQLWFAEQTGEGWLCSTTYPTIADIACFPAVMLSEEGGVSRLPYPAIRRWTDRVKRVPHFRLMPGIFGHSRLKSS